MKVSISKHNPVRMHLTAYEPGDQPPDAVDVPPALVNAVQKAQVALYLAEGAVRDHLKETGQQVGRKR